MSQAQPFSKIATASGAAQLTSSCLSEEWVARYDEPEESADFAKAIAVDGDGNVYVTGGTLTTGFEPDYLTVKYNAAGILQWTVRYNGPGNRDDNATDIAVDGSGNVYVTGYSYNSDGIPDYATIKYDGDGVQQWEARYNGRKVLMMLLSPLRLTAAGMFM